MTTFQRPRSKTSRKHKPPSPRLTKLSSDRTGIGKKHVDGPNGEFISIKGAVTVQETVETVGEMSFTDQDSMISITLPNVRSIYELAFQGCSSLRTVNSPKLEYIDSHAFSKCGALKNIILDGVRTIRDGAFERCINLENINLPKVKKIQNGAFRHCTGLKSITLSIKTGIDKLTWYTRGSVDDRAPFFGCTSLNSITFTGTCEDGKLRIQQNPFTGCANLKSITFEETFKDKNVALTAVNNEFLPPNTTKYWAAKINGGTAKFSSSQDTHSLLSFSNPIELYKLTGEYYSINLSKQSQPLNLHALAEKQYPKDLGGKNNQWGVVLPDSEDMIGNLTAEQLATFLLSDNFLPEILIPNLNDDNSAGPASPIVGKKNSKRKSSKKGDGKKKKKKKKSSLKKKKKQTLPGK